MNSQRVTILNGSLESDDRCDQLAALLRDRLFAEAWEVVVHRPDSMQIAPCLGCFGCWVKTPGECVIDDDARGIARDVVQSDLVVYLTPIVFGGYSATLKSAMDRLIPLIMPYFARVRGEVHHVKRYARYPRVLGIGLLPYPDPDQEELFAALVDRSSLNMRSPKTVVRVCDRPTDDVEAGLSHAIDEVMR